ncbi:putative internal virion protein [uncultured Mediterranean phage uvMED]|nr:putative internal virion protein [uncultured Mediterranean phage uvMED]
MSRYEQCMLKLSQAEQDEERLSQSLKQSIEQNMEKGIDPEAVVDELVNKISRAKREAAMQAVVLKKIKNFFDGYTQTITGETPSYYTKLMALLTKDSAFGAPYRNVEYTARSYSKRFHTDLSELLNRFQKKGLGFFDDEANLNKLIRAIYGEATDDVEINQFAKDWLKLVDRTVDLKNKFGASISKNEDFLLPQRHDPSAILKLAKDRNEAKRIWIDRIRDKLDYTKMLDDQGRQLTQLEIFGTQDEDGLLGNVFESIVTGGLNKVGPLEAPRTMGRKLSRKGSDQRVLYFKDAESWIEYQNDFGRGDIFGTLVDFIESSANDIALLELMGPNPETTWRVFLAQAQKSGINRIQARRLQDTWNVVSGRVNEGNPMAFGNMFQAIRNIDQAALLGTAFISAVSDTGFQLITAQYNKLPTFRILGKTLQTLTAPGEDLRIAAQIGLGADAWITMAHSSNRFGETYGIGLTSKIANAVMKASLLEPWTNGNKRAFGMEFSGALARSFDTEWEALDAGFRAMMERNGIVKREWDQFRSTEVLEYEGAVFANFNADESLKFQSMVLQETDIAVPSPDARVRSVMTMGRQRGTPEGEFYRSFFAIKSFPITIAMTHMTRGWYAGSQGSRAKYLGSLLVTTTALGAIALQAKDIVAGRDPRALNKDGGMIPDRDFLTASMLQGGGLGIFGDFVFADTSRFGKGLFETLAGPSFDTADRFVRFTKGTVRSVISDEEFNILGEGAKIIDRYTPSIWQTKLFEQAFFQSLQEMVDPEADKKLRRLMRSREKEYNQGFWWTPGEFAPDRAPDFENVIRE